MKRAAYLVAVAAATAAANAQSLGPRDSISGRCTTFIVDGLNRLSACPTEIGVYRSVTLTDPLDPARRHAKKLGTVIEIQLGQDKFLRVSGINEESTPTSVGDALGQAGGAGFVFPMRRADIVVGGDVTSLPALNFRCEIGRVKGRNIIHCVDHFSRPTFVITFLQD